MLPAAAKGVPEKLKETCYQNDRRKGKSYKAIREALKKDAELKARYEAILADVKDPNKS
jgi:hypothetical protein